MIEKTPALVLRYAPSGNTSRVVTWLTPEHGRIATMIKGALRPKSPFLGQYDLFYTCELLYYHRRDRELYIAKECSPTRLRAALRTDWRATALASYFTDLATRVSPANAPQRFLYHWLETTLDALANDGARSGFGQWAELKLLDQLGLAPSLRTCMACEAPLRIGQSNAFFSHQRGGLLCARCAQSDSRPAAALPADALAILRAWQQADTPDRARRTRCSPPQLAVINRFLGEFMRYHLDLPLPSRDLGMAISSRA